MAGRRAFLKGLIAATLVPKPSWADVGDPAFLAASQNADGGYWLCGLDGRGAIVFDIPLPGRGHAAAAHPTRPEAVAFARRPGTFALIIDCQTGDVQAQLTAPEGQHFYGHGVFSQDGTRLFTSENDIEAAEGRIGVWDVAQGYRRVGSFPSGGVGPHDLMLMEDGETLVIANGGIETHPDSGRAKLNIPFMEPNLSYLSVGGDILEQQKLPRKWHKNSIRHLAQRADGLVAFACQWEGDVAKSPPLLGLHRRGQQVQLCAAPNGLERDLQGYAGSVAFSGDGSHVALTGPRGNKAVIFDASGGFERAIEIADVGGVAPDTFGFVFSAGTGEFVVANSDGTLSARQGHVRQWDNHLVAL